ncbi:hypothetical protein HDV02_004865 [Globomyces sp. JEL0801]|nr:hypothetical protein HDV02_004865 [Globomyces sp. JEL0801]
MPNQVEVVENNQSPYSSVVTTIVCGIGGEYPASSVAASEASSDVPKNRHGLFIGVTNVAIDVGWALASFVSYLFAKMFEHENIEWIWRSTIAFGVIVPLFTLWFRMKLVEPKAYSQNRMQNIPYRLIMKKYWPRLLGISSIWFIYDLCTYPFGLYSSTITKSMLPKNHKLSEAFAWNTIILLFYVPGALFGGLLVNRIGPKKCLMIGLACQSILALLLAFNFRLLSNHMAIFALTYGLFLSFGEFGPGDNIGVLSSSSGPSVIRGQFYAIAGVCGKVGAFYGTASFESVKSYFATGGTVAERELSGNRGIFIIAAILNLFCVFIAYISVSELSEDAVLLENQEFRQYLKQNGFDLSETDNIINESQQ